MISVWAMEQRNRKFESQDVLIPWHKPPSRVGSVVGNRVKYISFGTATITVFWTERIHDFGKSEGKLFGLLLEKT